jgi:DNA repair exonuclease SbcCD ATPase subunit
MPRATFLTSTNGEQQTIEYASPQALSSLEKRVDSLKSEESSLDQQISSIGSRLDSVESQFDAVREKTREELRRVSEHVVTLTNALRSAALQTGLMREIVQGTRGAIAEMADALDAVIRSLDEQERQRQEWHGRMLVDIDGLREEVITVTKAAEKSAADLCEVLAQTSERDRRALRSVKKELTKQTQEMIARVHALSDSLDRVRQHEEQAGKQWQEYQRNMIQVGRDGEGQVTQTRDTLASILALVRSENDAQKQDGEVHKMAQRHRWARDTVLRTVAGERGYETAAKPQDAVSALFVALEHINTRKGRAVDVLNRYLAETGEEAAGRQENAESSWGVKGIDIARCLLQVMDAESSVLADAVRESRERILSLPGAEMGICSFLDAFLDMRQSNFQAAVRKLDQSYQRFPYFPLSATLASCFATTTPTQGDTR